jgi:glycosyltransferase involved in cell wall biosynthesis
VHISIIIPTFNEEESIAGVLDGVETAMKAESIDYEMIVVDDGSSDKTLEIARSRDVKIVRPDQNSGMIKTQVTGGLAQVRNREG